MSVINRTVHRTIQLGQGHIGDRLVIREDGAVLPIKAGADGVISDVAGGLIANSGLVMGGDGDPRAAGGVGVYLQAVGALVNQGVVTGGNVSLSAADTQNGGAGAVLSVGGRISNFGTIAGGEGSLGTLSAMTRGGNGVELLNGGVLQNHGMITGGADQQWYVASGGGVGGAGVYVRSGGQINNTGAIVGGYGGDAPYGEGGTGGAGVTLLNGGSLTNSGKIEGGAAGFGGGHYSGGAGVSSIGAVVTNTGMIIGGAGEDTLYGGPGVGGAGAVVASGQFTNEGVIYGGSGGIANEGNAPGGEGVLLNGGILANSGTIAAGAGEDIGNYGVVLNAGTFNNSGTVKGSYGDFFSGGGVLINGGDLTNTGVIAAGATDGGGTGGAGVFISGGVLTNAGTITGFTEDYKPGDAVQFGGAGTLVVDAGAVFNSLVVGDGSNDTLVLAAGPAGTLSGLGTEFVGFTNANEAAQSTWTVSGDSTLAAGTTLNVGGALTFAGNASGAGAAVIESGGTLTADGSLGLASVAFAAGGSAMLALGEPASVGSTLSGFGAGDTIDLVKMQANGLELIGNNTLLVVDGANVVATLTFAGDYTSSNFTLASDGNGGTNILFVAQAGSVPALSARDFGWAGHDAGVVASHAAPVLESWHVNEPGANDWLALPMHWGGFA
jgi:hypothetical protein